MAVALWGSVLQAQASLEWDRCVAGRNGVADNRIPACTVVIQAAREPKANLALAYASRGAAYVEMGDFDHALADSNAALALRPDSESALNTRARVLDAKGDHDRALADWTSALSLKPDYVEALRNRGRSRQNGGDLSGALSDFSRVVTLTPDQPRAYFERGQVLMIRGDLDRAVTDFDKAISLDPAKAETYGARAFAYQAKGDYDRAIADDDQALKIQPDLLATLRQRGAARLAKGQYAAAAEDLAEATRRDPTDLYGLLWLRIARAKTDALAQDNLASAAANLDLAAWPGPLIKLYLGQAAPDQVRRASQSGDDAAVYGQTCDADFYVGEYELLQGDRGAARTGFTAAATCAPIFFEHGFAVEELKRIS
jgi:lipoprotein NlpI